MQRDQIIGSAAVDATRGAAPRRRARAPEQQRAQRRKAQRTARKGNRPTLKAPGKVRRACDEQFASRTVASVFPRVVKRQTFSATSIHRIGAGKIFQTWGNADDLGRLLQLDARIEPATSEPA